jgi:hypothetical protein
MIAHKFPAKQVKVITPYNFVKSADLLKAAGGLHNGSEILVTHLKRSIFPEHVRDSNGTIVAIRPPEYKP